MSTEHADPTIPVHPLESDAWRSDYALSEDSQSELCSLLGGLRQALVQHDARIARIQATLAELLDERKSYVLRIDKVKSAVAPHKKLPPEILFKIFTDCSPPPLYIPPKHVRNVRHNITSNLEFPMTVCSRWRQVALSSRDMWDDLDVSYPVYTPTPVWTEKTKHITSLAQIVMLRGTRSVTIRIYGTRRILLPEEVEPIRNLVIPFAQQLTHITLGCSMPYLYDFLASSSPLFPALQSLTFRGEEDPTAPYNPDDEFELTMFKHCPNLRTLRINVFYLNFLSSLSQSDLQLPWNQLTKVNLQGTWIDLATAHLIFSQCTSLKSCSFSLLYLNEESLNVAVPLPTIDQPHLQHLTIWSTSGDPDVAGRFLESLVLPFLRSYKTADAHVDDSLPALTSLITRSRCSLRKLTVSAASIPAAILGPLFELLPALEALVTPKTLIPIPMLERMAQGSLLPKLTNVTCTIPCSPRSLEAFMDAVERTGAESSEVARLQVATARYPPADRNYRAPRWPQVNQRFKELAEKLEGEGRTIDAPKIWDIHSPGSFPRMPPLVYNTLKTRLLPRLQALYRHAVVPREAPEKISFGDLDILVTGPRAPGLSLDYRVVQNMIGAQSVRHDVKIRTTNFAVPIAHGEWEALNLGKEEHEARQAAGGRDIFYQVDVNACSDEAEHERIAFFHGYGDLGVIMSVTVRNLDPTLVLGEKGLRLSINPLPHFVLSHSMDDVATFMGWSMDAWEAGFRTNREAFKWVASSHFFNPRGFRKHGKGITKIKAHRTMYAEFGQWVVEKAAAAPPWPEHDTVDEIVVEQKRLAFREYVLAYFNKKLEFDEVAYKRDERARLKAVFNSSIVRDWAKLDNDWQQLQLVMDTVRERLKGDEGILKLYDESGESGVRHYVLGVQKQMSLLRQ
ncbi:hypothetical protein DXG01_008714 [Tephrocybe rancida]|nr:hypothetical protein DXG01_008714 [Tephrocybe rancida]